MARDRQRAKARKARRAAQNPGPAPSEPRRANVPGELDHASGEVDEFEAALVRGADGRPVDGTDELDTRDEVDPTELDGAEVDMRDQSDTRAEVDAAEADTREELDTRAEVDAAEVDTRDELDTRAEADAAEVDTRDELDTRAEVDGAESEARGTDAAIERDAAEPAAEDFDEDGFDGEALDEDAGDEDDLDAARDEPEPARRAGGAVAAREGAAAGTPTKGGIGRFAAFLRASWAELQRVQWPDRRQVAQATAVVLGFVVVAGAYLGLADVVAQEIVDFIL